MARNMTKASGHTQLGLSSIPQMPEGYYSGDRPNPNLRMFVEEHATQYNPETDSYDISPFSEPIETTKATAIYNMHVYWSKKPHDAVCKYISHYTELGDLVLDPFCGSGGTALAALIEGRKAIAIDRSPAATFITKNYCTPVNPDVLRLALQQLKQKIEQEINWLYETACDRCGGRAITGYTVYSEVFQCPRCLNKVPLFDCIEVQTETKQGKHPKIPVCPHCHPKHREAINTELENRFGSIPVLVTYQCLSGCKPRRGKRLYNDQDKRKREFFEQYDLSKLREIEGKPIPHWYPPHKMMNVTDDSQPWGDKWRAGTSNFRTVAELFTKRNLWALAAIRAGIIAVADDLVKDALLFGLTGIALNSSKMYKERDNGRGISSGTYYMPPISREMVVTNGFYYKVEQQLIPAFRELQCLEAPILAISTQSAINLFQIQSNSTDYIFTDPAYANKVQYGELNFVWEAWLDLDTHWHSEEIIVNHVRSKSEADWAEMMRKAMAECYRVLKPGRWLTLCYHDTSEGTWELVQDIMAEVGFVVDKTDSALFIGTGQKSYNQLTADKATKRDLVLNFRKPKPGEWIITQMYSPDTFRDAAIQVIRDFLTAHPGSTKDRIYDEVVSRLVRSRQMEAHDFDALLSRVAEEVREPVKKNLFENMEPDFFESHVISRWYLKETADQIDPSEQEKEDAAAARLEQFMVNHSTKHPETEGVHFSDLFEQIIIIPVHERPRRRFENWLPEYFLKTPSGTWRPPADQKEREQLAALREAGTLRRMKRFTNALIDGVPVREQDRPSNDRTLAEWIRQCRRAGLYEQGRVLYEKGGLDLTNLSEEEQIAVEDDYRISVRRGSQGEEQPKRQRRKKSGDV